MREPAGGACPAAKPRSTTASRSARTAASCGSPHGRAAKCTSTTGNLTLDDRGALIATGIDDLDDWRARTAAQGRISRDKLPFSIARIEPSTFDATPLFRGGPGLLEGGASVALLAGDALYVGSYAGDRLLKIESAGHRT
jgi:hypothetical protein